MKRFAKARIRAALTSAEKCTEAAAALGCTRGELANYMARTNDEGLRALYRAVATPKARQEQESALCKSP